jgi:pimeloyl-ACP methyl ester carboxylesterase
MEPGKALARKERRKMVILNGLLIFLTIGFGLWLVSYLVEALRVTPSPPQKLRWSPDIPLNYITIKGNQLRYLKAGEGPIVVLLHTLRTQLDIFEKVVPQLAKQFTVYALDYPGHGYSDIPPAQYHAQFFKDHIEDFLEVLDLRDVTLAGISIGGTIALIIASRRNPRIKRVLAINPYDYDRGRGMARSSLFGWIITRTSNLPIIGETVMRLRNFMILRSIFFGGVADPASIPPALLKEMYLVGNRHGHYRAFISLLRNSSSWEAARSGYPNINIPVLFLWGEKDWAKPAERAHDRDLVPEAEMVTIERGGHFLSLDRPDAIISHLLEMHGRKAVTSGRGGSAASTSDPV